MVTVEAPTALTVQEAITPPREGSLKNPSSGDASYAHAILGCSGTY